MFAIVSVRRAGRKLPAWSNVQPHARTPVARSLYLCLLRRHQRTCKANGSTVSARSGERTRPWSRLLAPASSAGRAPSSACDRLGAAARAPTSAEIADRAVVMYAGRAVEEADVNSIFAEPLMPYTLGLMNSIPRVDRAAEHQERLQAIPGNVPNPLNLPEGCAFHPRCRFVQDRCKAAIPPLEDAGNGHQVRCVRWNELDLKSEILA